MGQRRHGDGGGEGEVPKAVEHEEGAAERQEAEAHQCVVQLVGAARLGAQFLHRARDVDDIRHLDVRDLC